MIMKVEIAKVSKLEDKLQQIKIQNELEFVLLKKKRLERKFKSLKNRYDIAIKEMEDKLKFLERKLND